MNIPKEYLILLAISISCFFAHKKKRTPNRNNSAVKPIKRIKFKLPIA